MSGASWITSFPAPGLVVIPLPNPRCVWNQATTPRCGWRRFTKRVVSDARGHGLVLERISLSAVFWLWVGLVVPAGLALAAGAWIWLCLLTYVVLAWRVLVLHRPLPTGAGQAGCCRIPGLGVQLKAETAALKRDSSSASRTSAYAVGLGIAGPTQSLFAPQLDRTVWSLRNLATDTHR
jgi:hypothetical protein